MQSIFRLPWGSDPARSSEKAHLDKMNTSPLVEIPRLPELKRKRADSSQDSVPPVKKQQTGLQAAQANSSSVTAHLPELPCTAPVPSTGVAPSPATPRESSTPDPARPTAAQIRQTIDMLKVQKSNSDPSRPKSMTDKVISVNAHTETAKMTGLSPLQQVIENEFNVQILMKHNELRLIEQELAKCQVALEQLRRCELRPFPGTLKPDVAVTDGLGPAVAPPPGFSRPSHPAPYGVTDGPYSRHYKQWLLHDPQFDSISPEALAYAEASVNTANRPTRGAGHIRKSASKSLGSSTRSSDPLHSIPNYPSALAKDKSSPLVLRRSTDNQLVKLICNDCLRGNFSSIQGYLNHCRIAHKVDYKSHDEAAIKSGRVLDENEKANLPAEAHAVQTSKPSISRASTSAAPTPSRPSQPSGRVHPLNTSVGASKIAPRPRPQIPAAPVHRNNAAPPQIFSSTPFQGSSQAPRLSAFMEKQNMGGNLEQAIANARSKIDLNDEDLLSPDTPDSQSPITPIGPGGRTLGNHGYFPRPPSRKGYRQPAQRPRPSPLAPTPGHESRFSSSASSPNESGSAIVSPRTVESEPGLVSDHEEDDVHSVSEEEAPQMSDAHPSLTTTGRTCTTDEMEIDIEEETIGGLEHGVLIRRNSMLADEGRGVRAGRSQSRKLGGK